MSRTVTQMCIRDSTYAILTVPVAAKDTVYYLYGGSAVKFSLPDLFAGIFGDGMLSLTLGVLVAIVLGGLVAAFFAWLIGLPVLRLKSDYLAIATLGFAEIIRAVDVYKRQLIGGANGDRGKVPLTPGGDDVLTGGELGAVRLLSLIHI